MECPLGLGWIRRAHRDAASLLADREIDVVAVCLPPRWPAWSAGPRRPARSGSPGRRRAIMPDRGSPPVSTPATRPDTRACSAWPTPTATPPPSWPRWSWASSLGGGVPGLLRARGRARRGRPRVRGRRAHARDRAPARV